MCKSCDTCFIGNLDVELESPGYVTIRPHLIEKNEIWVRPKKA